MHNGSPIILRKIAICRVPTAADEYSDFSVIAIFDYAIACFDGGDLQWTVLLNQFQLFFEYSDAIFHRGLVFAVTERGSVYVWDPLDFGKF
jgi:hypothetical protein